MLSQKVGQMAQDLALMGEIDQSLDTFKQETRNLTSQLLQERVSLAIAKQSINA